MMFKYFKNSNIIKRIENIKFNFQLNMVNWTHTITSDPQWNPTKRKKEANSENPGKARELKVPGSLKTEV